jgi:AraC-like DNA-binding protein/mannose-6-phosphate isomerase-like protein (cupin superfamily)
MQADSKGGMVVSIPYEKRTADFYHRDDDGGRHPLACSAHLHVHIELFYLIEGKMRAYIDSSEYTVEKGDILIAFPNRVHRFEAVEPERYLLFIIHPDMMPELSSVFSRRTPKSPLIKGATDDEALISLLHLLANTDAPSPYRDVTRKGLLSAFFGRLLDKIELIEPRTEDSHAIRDVVNFCSEHFTSDLSLEMLEENLHLSRYYISHLFSHKLNIRFNDYVNSLRVSEACRLLRATTMGITDISAQVGFNTLRTFNRSFVKQMGQSPSEYRRRLAATAG